MGIPAEFKLDHEESLVLVVNLAITQALLLLLGLLGAVLVVGISTGDWLAATIGMAWLSSIGESLCALSWVHTAGAAIVVAALLGLLATLSERRAMASKRGIESVQRIRNGINGELARLPVALLVFLTALIGFSEEFLFRFVLLGGLNVLLCLVLPEIASAGIALLVSSAAFWLAHTRYTDAWAMKLAFALGVVFGLAYFATGSLALVALAHALYDLYALLSERFKMRREPDYFGGPAPRRVLLDSCENDAFDGQTLSEAASDEGVSSGQAQDKSSLDGCERED